MRLMQRSGFLTEFGVWHGSCNALQPKSTPRPLPSPPTPNTLPTHFPHLDVGGYFRRVGLLKLVQQRQPLLLVATA